jgi:hypothetical protein
MKKIYQDVLLSILVVGIAIASLIYDRIHKHLLPIDYDKTHVEKLDGLNVNSSGFKEEGYFFSKEENWSDDLAEVFYFFNAQGIAWENDPGDFCRIKIKLPNGKADSYDSSEWLNIFKQIKNGVSRPKAETLVYPKESPNIKLRPYGITLNLKNGDKILALISYGYNSDPAALFTLIYIGKEKSELIFNKLFDLYEIRENESGYELLGVESVYAGCCEAYKITITDKALTYGLYPLEKVYEGKEDPKIILYNAIGYNPDRKEGEFTRIELPDLQDDVPSTHLVPKQFFDVFPRKTIWTPVPEGIKLDKTQTVIATPYYLLLNQPTGKIMLYFANNEAFNEADATDLPPATFYTAKIVPFNPFSETRCCFTLLEIVEDEEAYHLRGLLPHPYPYTRKEYNDPNQVYEIKVDKATMEDRPSWLKD